MDVNVNATKLNLPPKSTGDDDTNKLICHPELREFLVKNARYKCGAKFETSQTSCGFATLLHICCQQCKPWKQQHKCTIRPQTSDGKEPPKSQDGMKHCHKANADEVLMMHQLGKGTEGLLTAAAHLGTKHDIGSFFARSSRKAVHKVAECVIDNPKLERDLTTKECEEKGKVDTVQ